MSNVDNSVVLWTVANLVHELAMELDDRNDDEDFAALGSDSALVALRQAVGVLRDHGGPVSDVVVHLERRLAKASPTPLQPASGLESQIPVSFSSWSGGRQS